MVKLSSTDKHYRLAIMEINRLRGDRKIKLLEVGAGAKILEKFLPKNIVYDTLDNSPDFWNKKYTYNYDLNSDKMPIKSNIYDIVVCNEVLEHVPYPDKVIEEIKRVAKPNAIFFFSLPNEYNFVMRLYYLLAKKTKTEESFKVVEKALHIHKPRVQDIIDLMSRHFNIRKVEYTWQSRKSEKSAFLRALDIIIDKMAKIYPSLFARTVSLLVTNKPEH